MLEGGTTDTTPPGTGSGADGTRKGDNDHNLASAAWWIANVCPTDNAWVRDVSDCRRLTGRSGTYRKVVTSTCMFPDINLLFVSQSPPTGFFDDSSTQAAYFVVSTYIIMMASPSLPIRNISAKKSQLNLHI